MTTVYQESTVSCYSHQTKDSPGRSGNSQPVNWFISNKFVTSSGLLLVNQHHTPLHCHQYRQASDIRHQVPKLKCLLSRLAVVFAQSTQASCWVENENVVGAAPTGDAPTTSELSTILLPTKVKLILEVWRYMALSTYNEKICQKCLLLYIL